MAKWSWAPWDWWRDVIEWWTTTILDKAMTGLEPCTYTHEMVEARSTRVDLYQCLWEEMIMVLVDNGRLVWKVELS